MKQDSHITIAQLAERIGIVETTVETNIRKLKEKGVLQRIGSARGGYWEVDD